MKFYITLFIFSLSSTFLAGGVNLPVSFSPDNPIVGQPVTFTSSCSGSSYGSVNILRISSWPDITVNSTSNIFTYTFPVNGSFSGLGIACNIPINVSPRFNSVDLSNGSGPVGSITVSNATASSSAIPTLGEWGLIILGIIMLGIGLVSMRQKRVLAMIEEGSRSKLY